MSLLQIGLPGGPELLVIGLIFLLLFGIPLALVVAVGVLWLRSSEGGGAGTADEERIEELESEIELLRERLDEATDGGPGGPESAEPDRTDDR